MHNLGALSLDSQPLKFSLRAEAANWKVHFSKTIHKRAAADLMVRVGGGGGGEKGRRVTALCASSCLGLLSVAQQLKPCTCRH